MQWLAGAGEILGKAAPGLFAGGWTLRRGRERSFEYSEPDYAGAASLLVPVVVWAIASNQMLFAFLLFAAAGVSDAVDGFLAKRFGMASELGAPLDPLADKVLIVSIYVSLGISTRCRAGW